jgi:protein-S-isoprenylcysteine O-methyltransferase Ste14
MNAYRSRPLKYPWPSIVYVTALCSAYALHRIYPLAVLDNQRFWLWTAGGFAFLLGISLIFWALKTLLRHHTSVLSTRSTAHLVTSGPFRLTRNPVYLGYTLIMLSLGLMTGSFWLIAASVVSGALIHLYVIRREEKHLLARFGFEFERYCRRTRAWI